VAATGSAGALACGDYLKQKYPLARLAASEALQCPTLLMNGFGSHRIEGIGDKHIPWIHNVRNTDMVIAVDDEAPVNLTRLFNEPAGRDYLAGLGLEDSALACLPLLGISGIANLLAAAKFAKYYELAEIDVVFTVFTDSMDLYRSRLGELAGDRGPYGREAAVGDYHRHIAGCGTGHVLELSHYERKRIHNLKYFTWVEQQGKPAAELDAQWGDWPEYWTAVQNQVEAIDRVIREFNRDAGTQ
jgi:hypothetical protein